MINGTSIEDIGGRKILEPFTVTLIHAIMEIAVILGKMRRHFVPCSLADFLKIAFFRSTLKHWGLAWFYCPV